MDGITFLSLLVLAYSAGVITHWIMARNQRRLLKQYRQREHMLRQVRPIE